MRVVSGRVDDSLLIAFRTYFEKLSIGQKGTADQSFIDIDSAKELESRTFSVFRARVGLSATYAFVPDSSPAFCLIAHSADLSAILTSQSKGDQRHEYTHKP